MDTLTTAQRSERMSKVRAKDTKPELLVRRLVHGLGFRYRLHRKDLPGRPDIVLPGRRKIILVHGCFWHRHAIATCKLARLPKSNLPFWTTKFDKNKIRDAKVLRELRGLGWSTMTIWECELSRPSALQKRVREFLR
jgi:DNA mismatch endonuclease (patch repair protein)